MKTLSPTGTARGFTLIELIVIVLTLVLLVVILVTGSVRAQHKARRISCLSNLKIIDLSFSTWSLDHAHQYPPEVPAALGGTKEFVVSGEVFVHLRVMSNELTTPRVLVCPEDKIKTAAQDFGPRFCDTNVSYFVSLDAKERFPQMFAVGDRNLTSHGEPLKRGLFVLTTNNSSLTWTKTFHKFQGNIGLADGSIQWFRAERLAEGVQYQGVATNRLAIP